MSRAVSPSVENRPRRRRADLARWSGAVPCHRRRKARAGALLRVYRPLDAPRPCGSASDARPLAERYVRQWSAKEIDCVFLKHAKVWGPSATAFASVKKTKTGEYLIADSVAALVGLAQMDVVARPRSLRQDDGGKGLHVVVPLTPRADWSECLAFACALAGAPVRRSPGPFTERPGPRHRYPCRSRGPNSRRRWGRIDLPWRPPHHESV